MVGDGALAGRSRLRRVLLVTLVCTLLLLPLVGLLSVTLLRTTPRDRWSEKLIPMLAPDVRQALRTYRRDCHTDADCEPPLGCLVKNSSPLHMCLDSTCETDRQCDEGFSCLPFKTVEGKAIVRTCALVGERKEGERCTVLPAVQHDGCEPGLLCQGRCGRPCRLDEPSTCPDGFFCSEGREGPPSCLPTCKGRPCPEGLKCLKRGSGASVCARVLGEDCRKNPCPEKHACRVLEPPQRPWELRTECRRFCDEDFSCPEGSFCLEYECRKSCDPQAAGSCGPGLTCGRHHPLDPWFCIAG
jgi:hypothetical protein